MEVCQGEVSNMVGTLVIYIWKSAREKYQMVGKLVIDIWKSAKEETIHDCRPSQTRMYTILYKRRAFKC